MKKMKILFGMVMVLAVSVLLLAAPGMSRRALAADQGSLVMVYTDNTAVTSGPSMRSGVTSTVVDISKYNRFGVCVRVKAAAAVIRDIYYQVADTTASWSYPAGTTGTIGAVTTTGSHCASFTPVPGYYMRFMMFGSKGTAGSKIDMYLFRQ